jgi:DtxR family Mn-dependent transcriptional regulator
MATSTVEDYLKCILMEEQRNPSALVATGTIAESLDVAPGTVTAMVKTLAESGLLRHEPYSGVRLTRAGRQLAIHVLRRHRLVELFLVQVMGLDWSEVHDEAEHLEHAVSDRVIQRMDDMLGHPSVDPHGDPIPDAEGTVREPDLPNLVHCPLGVPLRVARVQDQSAEFLQLVERRGLQLDSRLRVVARSEPSDTVELRLEDDRKLSLGFRAASKILVQPLSEKVSTEEPLSV